MTAHSAPIISRTNRRIPGRHGQLLYSICKLLGAVRQHWLLRGHQGENARRPEKAEELRKTLNRTESTHHPKMISSVIEAKLAQ
jgi:hypothetical protein